MSLRDSRWFQRLQHRILQQARILQLKAPLEHGGPYLLDALRSKLPPLVWFELTERESRDLVAQTNKLVEAFNRTVEHNIMDYGITPPYIGTMLLRYDAIFDRYCFVCSGADPGPELMELFHQMVDLGHRVILLGEMHLDGVEVVPRQELLLTEAEAAQLAGVSLQLAPEVAQVVFQRSQGVFEKFWVESHLQKGWSIPYQPCAGGRRVPRGFEVEIRPDVLLPMLLRKEKYLEALELAAEAFPEKVLDFLETAASRMVLQGEQERLLEALNRLPTPYRSHEEVMRWRLEAAYLMDQQERMRGEVLAYLQEHEAPDLRALASNLWFFGSDERFYQEALRAVKHKRSSLSVQALARAYRWQIQKLSDIQQYVDLSFEALRLAEEGSNVLQVIRASGSLPHCLLLNNQLQEAAYWANWSVQHLQGLPVVNAIDRLLTMNAWYYLRILTGQHDGLEQDLQEALALSRNTSETMFYHLNATWSEYCLISGQPGKALDYWMDVWKRYNRHDKGRFAYYLVRLLIALGRDQEAEYYAREALALSADAPPWKKRYAHLALALALANVRPEEALKQLGLVEEIQQFKYCDRMWIAAPLLKRSLLERMGEVAKKEATLKEDAAESRYLEKLSVFEQLEYIGSFRLLEMQVPEAEEQDRLLIRTLGRSEVRLRGQALDLSPRQMEIIVLLAQHPQGLTGEQLLIELYGDEGSYGNLKALISRLRRIVPIESQPYKLQLEYRADFLELQDKIRQGRMEQVIQLYGGRFMEPSQAPGIEALRQDLERQIKSLAENSRDPEFVLKLAEKFEDDLELWEHLGRIMPRHNQHYAFVMARIRQLREEWGVV